VRIVVLIAIDPEDGGADELDVEFAEDLVVTWIRALFEELRLGGGDEPRDVSPF